MALNNGDIVDKIGRGHLKLGRLKNKEAERKALEDYYAEQDAAIAEAIQQTKLEEDEWAALEREIWDYEFTTC